MNDATRQQLRRRILVRRDGLTPDERRGKSAMVANNLWQLDEFANTATLFIYVNFRSEVETLPLIRQCLARGMRVAVPLTDTDNSCLAAVAITDPDRDLRPGYCGILEPAYRQRQAVDPKEIETIILPGSVFDVAGGRLGYGGGYYDRFIADSAPRALRIGIAFEQQVVANVPLLPHDQRLNILVTEERIIRISKNLK